MNDFLNKIEKIAAKVTARLHYLAWKAGVPARDCEDVVQEALADAVRQLAVAQFRGESSLGTWLHRILSGKIADYWRAKRRRPPPLTDGRDPGFRESRGGNDLVDRLPDRRQDAEQAAAVGQALSRLDPIHRLVLSLNHYGGYTAKEIAARLGRPPGTIDRILNEAKRQFRAHYLGEESAEAKRLLKGAAGEPGRKPKKKD
jgi:RNA polymerase sigma-70 factor, ECF subfamily